jgi:hypothetical protein
MEIRVPENAGKFFTNQKPDSFKKKSAQWGN